MQKWTSPHFSKLSWDWITIARLELRCDLKGFESKYIIYNLNERLKLRCTRKTGHFPSNLSEGRISNGIFVNANN